MISKRLKKELEKKRHPDQEKGEIFLFNATQGQVDLMAWDYFRLGEQTEHGLHPVFVTREEFSAHYE
jgi:hypothetical protein